MEIDQDDVESMRRGFWAIGLVLAPIELAIGIVVFLLGQTWALALVAVGVVALIFFFMGYRRDKSHRSA
ncbi:hypothetical protein EDF39_0575 [Frondihabitans sp. PhB161]|nr:hypothetical protein EDF37_0574 [Frondihabitans sp. PhB153]RPF08185.1 hypothetical protein EDF39_0575 [Frondihabitans sp. PhB161]